MRQIQLSLIAGANPNEGLFDALEHGQPNAVKLLLRHGADPNFQKDGMNAVDFIYDKIVSMHSAYPFRNEWTVGESVGAERFLNRAEHPDLAETIIRARFLHPRNGGPQEFLDSVKPYKEALQLLLSHADFDANKVRSEFLLNILGAGSSLVEQVGAPLRNAAADGSSVHPLSRESPAGRADVGQTSGPGAGVLDVDWRFPE